MMPGRRNYAGQALFCGLALLVALGAAPSGWAQDAKQVEEGRTIFKSKADCGFCHGWAADGRGDPRSEGGAPSLRVTKLERDQVVEVIACGRPGTAMPHHDRFAYTDKRCYGMTEEELGKDKPNRSSNTLQKREIEAVADFIVAKIKGHGPVTFEECQEFWGAGAPNCQDYPKAAR